MSNFSCPNCGTEFAPEFATTRMMNCPSCGTSVFIDGEALRLAGEQGVMHDIPMLFGLGDRVTLEGQAWRPIGHARFSYGRGSWDEFWAIDAKGRGAWVSIDEGEVVVQDLLAEAQFPSDDAPPPVGGTVSYAGRSYRVTEVETATCEALRGELPEAMTVGERYDFANCTGPDGELLSGEFWPGGRAWYLGRWVDPFDVRKVGT